MKQKKRVVLGMSGGLDSSVAAALLKRRGYDVIGITMQLLPKESEKLSACCNLNSICDAKRVAQQVGIPHYTINIRDTFKKQVIDYFINDYLLGLTPNPCVECNRSIKFNELQTVATDLQADYIATGHYCQITKSTKTNDVFLKKGKDPTKDQSYFLYMLTQSQLKKTLFPLGGYLKSEIRALAEKLSLFTAKKAESQEICFVTQGNYASFIEKEINKQLLPGHIISTAGTILGQHKGIHHYTIGQRRGLNLASETPLYVLKINAKNNTIMVGQKDELSTSTIQLKNISLVNPSNLIGKSFEIKSRYQMTPFQSRITHLDPKARTMTLQSHSPQTCISPGQSCVLYKGSKVIGGGTIL